MSSNADKLKEKLAAPFGVELALKPDLDSNERLMLGLTALMCVDQLKEKIPGSDQALAADKRKIVAEHFGNPVQTVDPHGLKEHSPALCALYILQQKYGGELDALKRRASSLARKYLAEIRFRFEKDLLKYGPPYVGGKRIYVREAAFRLIDPHFPWAKGTRLNAELRPITFAARAHAIQDFDRIYEIGPRMTLALAMLIEVANEVRMRGVANDGYMLDPGKPNKLVCKILVDYGFNAIGARNAASLIITARPSVNDSKAKGSEKRLRFPKH